MHNPNRHGVAAFALLLAASTTAADTYRASMTGEQLVRDMLANPAVELNAFKRQRAMGYLDGIMDATVGTQWCPAGKPVPHELNYLLTEEIARLPVAKLQGDAAPLVGAALRKLFPCAAGSQS